MIEVEFWSILLGSIAVLVLFGTFVLPIFRHEGTSKAVSFLMSGVMLAGLLLVLAQPFLRERKDSSNALLLVDISESMPEGVSELLLERIQSEFGDSVTIDTLPFGGTTATTRKSLIEHTSYSALQRSAEYLDTGQTDLERALQHAVSANAQSVLLISDGFETKGDAERMLPLLKKNGTRVFPIVPEEQQESADRFRITQLYTPLVASAEEKVSLRTTVTNRTSKPQSGLLEITHGTEIVYKGRITVAPGQDLLVEAESDPTQEGIQPVKATLSPENSQHGGDSKISYLSSEERERVLVLSGATVDDRFLTKVLRRSNYQVKSFVSEIPPGEQQDLNRYFAVILNNAPYRALPANFEKAISSFVKDGGGLITIGGDRSFGLGSYKGKPIAKLFPVEPLTPRKERKRLNVAVMLVLDKSKSMKFGQKIEFAKEAAKEVVRNLKDDDYLGVIGFDTTPFLAMPLRKMGTNRSMALSRIGTLFPTGKTNLFPAIDEGRRSLKSAQAGRKHMIVLTDGKIPDGGPKYLRLVEEMRLLGITVSTVMMGAEADVQLLKNMADAGGGAFYQTRDVRALPRIFLSDLKVSTGEQTVREQREYVVRTGADGILSTDLKRFPRIRGYVQTKIKPGASLELVAFAAGKAEPLLASWNVEKGKSIAFTSDANGRWSKYWISWANYAQFWRDLVESLQPQESALREKIKFDLRYQVQKGKLIIDTTLFADTEPSGIGAVLVSPDGKEQNIELTRKAPGRYRAQMADVSAGKYTVRLKADNRSLTPVAFHLSGELLGEQSGQGFAIPALASIASATGGKLNPQRSDLSAKMSKTESRQDLRPWLLISLAALLCLEVLRREVWGRRFLRRARGT